MRFCILASANPTDMAMASSATAKVFIMVSSSLKRADVRFGSKADISQSPRDVRFTPKSGHGSARW